MGKQSRRRRQNDGPSSKGERDVTAPAAVRGSNANAVGGVTASSVSSAAPPQTTLPIGASCWICLEEGPDEDGQPIVRDCSCRGNSGIAHLGCIVKYAERKSEELDHDISKGSMEAWERCPNCHQEYQNALKLNLANALLSFTKKTFPCDPRIKCADFPCDPYRYVEALYIKLCTLNAIGDEGEIQEAKKIGTEILSVARIIKTYPGPVIFGSSVPKLQITYIEACTYKILGMLITGDIARGLVDRDQGPKYVMDLFEKSRDLSNSIGDSAGVSDSEEKIIQIKQWFQGASAKKSVKYLREQYKQTPDLTTGTNLVMALQAGSYFIECERLLTEIIANSRRVHGTCHDSTKSFEAILQSILSRRVILRSTGTGNDGAYQALRYEDSGEKCVLQGPIADPRNTEKEKTLTVGSDELLIHPGVPVICHGLKNASHLNGKIGDIRGFDFNARRYKVRFEDTNVKPCLLKPENVRILFALPSKSDMSH